MNTNNIRITYVGYNSDFYCFRVHVGEAIGMVAHMKQAEISEWLFDNATEWFMGNQFPYPDHPQIFFEDTKKQDVFVIFKNFTDTVLFENKFKVTGITPSMLNP